MNLVRQALETLVRQAREQRDAFGNEPVARALEHAVSEVTAALQAEEEAALSLREAARRSGYSVDHLARLIREGRLVNIGAPRRPQLRCGDLPRKVAPPCGKLNIACASAEQVARSLIKGDRR